MTDENWFYTDDHMAHWLAVHTAEKAVKMMEARPEAHPLVERRVVTRFTTPAAIRARAK